MDYERVYREFIADRRKRESSLTGYTERHHILPRGMGGTDDPENLISLTAEDHFFAHLVLAKWHNTMAAWGAVMVMHERKTRKTIFTRRSRERYGWARRRYGAFCSTERVGAANPNYRAELIEFKNADGRLERRTRLEWAKVVGIPHPQILALLTGKNLSYKGWMLPNTDPAMTGPGAGGRSKRTKTKYRWRHLDGRREHLSPPDLADKHGIRANDLSSVVRGEHKMCAGWYIEGRDVGWPGGRKHFRDDRLHHFVHRDGRQATGTQIEMIEMLDLDQREVSTIVTGRRKSCGGWMLKSTAAKGYKPRVQERGRAKVSSGIRAAA